MTEILVVEDDVSQAVALCEYLENEFSTARVSHVEKIEQARKWLKAHVANIIISDLMLPDGTGIDLLKEKMSESPLLILTGQPTIESAVQAIQSGASDYLMKPVDLRLLKDKVRHLLRHWELQVENKQLQRRLSSAFNTENFIGTAPEIHSLLQKVNQIAATEVTVLIEGESGTGKELIANLIHESSNRSDRPFIKVNCGALTKSILESELFGVTRGAYTGAEKDRAGYFEAASGGTIFLDEIGEMDLESQVRLLRVLEEREVTRIGSTAPIAVDVRIIAATNRRLLKIVDEEKFREDLYYRLAVVSLTLPSLRERSGDIPLLFNHFVTEFNEKYGKSVTRLAPDLLQFFKAYDWPGNVRQFRNVIEGMVVLAQEDTLTKEDLPAEMLSVPGGSRRLETSIVAGVPLEDYEKAIIRKNLEISAGNREKTASQLGISERTLYRKIKEYNL